MSILEALMLVCFGLSWPVSIAKALRTKVVAGKSWVFMLIVALGYCFGISHKLLHSLDWVTGLYVLNLLMVLTDLSLYLRYYRRATITVARA